MCLRIWGLDLSKGMLILKEISEDYAALEVVCMIFAMNMGKFNQEITQLNNVPST